jgi:hypothetical protein
MAAQIPRRPTRTRRKSRRHDPQPQPTNTNARLRATRAHTGAGRGGGRGRGVDPRRATARERGGRQPRRPSSSPPPGSSSRERRRQPAGKMARFASAPPQRGWRRHPAREEKSAAEIRPRGGSRWRSPAWIRLRATVGSRYLPRSAHLEGEMERATMEEEATDGGRGGSRWEPAGEVEGEQCE